MILRVHIYYHLNEPNSFSIKKPSFTYEKLSVKKLQKFENFINDKAHVIMNSYKINSKTGKLIKYFCNTKQALWEKFYTKFPNRICYITFMTKL